MLIRFSKLFVSSKFYKKIEFISSLDALTKVLPSVDFLKIPEEIKRYDDAKTGSKTSSLQKDSGTLSFSESFLYYRNTKNRSSEIFAEYRSNIALAETFGYPPFATIF